MPHTPRPRRTLARVAAAAVLAVGCALGTAAADVVILKDGFVIQGKVHKETERIVDKASGQSFTVPSARGFDMVDEGPKFVIFSSNAKQLGEINKDVKIRPEYEGYSMPFVRRKADPPPYGQYVPQGDWDAKWMRKLRVNVPGGGFELVEQQITSIDPYKTMVYSPTHSWRLAFSTAELGPERAKKLLSTHPKFVEEPGKPDPAKRLLMARFFKDAGWLFPAKQEVEELKKLFPGGLPKEATEQAETLLKEIEQAVGEAVVQEAEVAINAGRYEGAEKLLAGFPDKTAGARDAVKAAALRAQHKAAVTRHEAARRLLRDLLDRTGVPAAPAAVGGGPAAAAAWVRGLQTNPQLARLAEAGEQVFAEMHPDSVGRLEVFVQFAEQADRERANGQEVTRTADQLLAAAVSGWVRGRNGAITDATPALRLWAAREIVLAYQRTDDVNTRNNLLREYRQSAAHSPDELAQVIALLPPCEPENLSARTGTPVPGTDTLALPPGVYRRKSAGSDTLPSGVDYLVRLPSEYSHGRAYPVVLALTDASGGPEVITAALAYEADRHGYILVAPDWGKAGPDWKWRGEDHAYATDVLRDAVRHFSVDNDRVFLFGGGSGANMALDIGLSHPDLFAGLLLMVPTPNTLVNVHYWKNGQKLPVYAVTGEQTGPALTALRRLFENWMPKGYPGIMSVYKGRGAEWFGAEVPAMFDWMSRKRRPGPAAVLQLDPGNTTPAWQAHRPTDNRFYWVGVNRIVEKRHYDPKAPGRVPAVVSGDIQANRIKIQSNGAPQVSVWLTRDLIDWTKPITVSIADRPPLTVSINGAPPVKWKPQVIEPSLEVLLKDYAERGDRRRLVLQKLDFPAQP